MKNITFSDFGTKLTGESGILTLMDDIGKPLPKGVKPYRLGGGNPARIPQIERLYRSRMESILKNGDEFERLIGLYDSPQGRMEFINCVAEYLSKTYGWKIGPENIAVTNGSQSAFFYIFNLFSGNFTKSNTDGSHTSVKKTILLPISPEYIGYADQGLGHGQFVSIPSAYSFDEDKTFKYHVDFDALEYYLSRHDNVGAMCVSRPTNPTGNVLTDTEIKRLAKTAREHDIPLMIDNAYGLPWPDIIFTDDAAPYWDDNVILSMSLSKIGLPSLRTGIIVADKKIVSAISNINAIAALASGSVGQALAGSLIKDGTLIESAKKYVRPYYQKKSLDTQKWIHEEFAGSNYYVHKSEGSIFQWLYMPDLKIPAKKFYSELKERGVIVVPGEYFFFGNTADNSLPRVESHPHYDKCLRLNYAGDGEEVRGGLKIIAELYRKYS